ncbi:MSMEG_0565 family glycosyltransferase [Microlunatus flavus]|uniref:Glycosyltransferase, MSMEG_0565 family n=1 Tax=Microlunatus flavus TaxID=1036181 RepID=A0A1H9G7D3_9ACTN|nr:glycosyltransferase, MSMEG_0565 family [Microlunatus flavus]
MRVALLTYSTKPRGGVVHTLALAEALARLGADVTVWTVGRGGDDGFFRPVDPQVEVEVAPLPHLEGETVGARIQRSIRVLGTAFADRTAAGVAYDVVHAQDCISANAVPRCVRTVHHLDQFTTPELVACHERAIVRPYAHVCVSAAVAVEVEAGWGLRPTVIPNGVEAQRFVEAAADPGASEPWRRRFGRYVLAVGGIEPRKGTLDLLEAFALARRTRPELELVLAGGETLFDYRGYREAFDARAVELGVVPHVLGPVDHAALPGLVAGCAAFGFVSTKEGFGLAAMEALAAGVPVLARPLPVLREVFGDHVRYADEKRSMAAALLECVERGPLPGGAGLALHHTWERAARSHLDLYASLSARPGAAARRRDRSGPDRPAAARGPGRPAGTGTTRPACP